jgi:hypothetical protein
VSDRYDGDGRNLTVSGSRLHGGERRPSGEDIAEAFRASRLSQARLVAEGEALAEVLSGSGRGDPGYTTVFLGDRSHIVYRYESQGSVWEITLRRRS